MALTAKKRIEMEAMFASLASNDVETRARAAFSFMSPLEGAQAALNRYKARVAHAMKTKDVVFGLAAVAAYQAEIGEMSDDGANGGFLPTDRFGKLLATALRQASYGGTESHDVAQAGGHGWFAASRWRKDLKAFLAERLAAGDAAMAESGHDDVRSAVAFDLASVAWSEYDFGDVVVDDADGWEAQLPGEGVAELTRGFYVEGEDGGTVRCSFVVRVDPVDLEVVEAVAYDPSGNQLGSRVTSVRAGSLPRP